MIQPITKTVSISIKNENTSFTTSLFHPATPVNTLFSFGKAINTLQNGPMTQLKKTTVTELMQI